MSQKNEPPRANPAGGPIVRRAIRADLPRIGKLGALLVKAHHEFDALRFIAATNRTPEAYASFLGTQLEEPDVAIFVAEEHADVIGYAYAGVESYDYMSLRGPAGVLHDIVVDTERRGRGTGRLLLQAALTYLRSRGAPRVVLSTAERNEAAQRLFASAGFRRTMIEMTRELTTSVRELASSDEFRRGLRENFGPSLGISAWALVTGVAMIKSGLTVPLAVLMSLIVYAGSAQLAALPLIAAGAPLWVIWATAFCMNLRFVIFSAHWRKYFGHLPRPKRLTLTFFAADLNYVLFVRRFPEPKPAPEQIPYYLGSVCWSWLSWEVPALIGIALAERVPTEWGLDFAGVLALLGLAYSTLSGRNTWIAAGLAAAAAVAAFHLPLRLNIVVAIAAGVAIGMLLDRYWPDAPESRRR